MPCFFAQNVFNKTRFDKFDRISRKKDKYGEVHVLYITSFHDLLNFFSFMTLLSGNNV